MATNDAELVARARAGEREAFGAIFDRYGDRIHDFCASYLRDPHDGADATQDAFLLAAQRLEQLRDPTAVRPWLYAIARSVCLRRIRDRRRTEPSEVVVDVAVDDRADEQVHRGELQVLLADAAAGLSDRDRELLDLRLRHDLSTGEVAEVLEVTSDHASVLLGRMRERVERSLGALLVARQGADDCPQLADLLGDWDGRFDPRLRKRVARHVDDCPTCADHRSRALAPSAMLSVAPLLAAPAGLREQIVRSAALPGSPGADGGAGPPPSPAGSSPDGGGLRSTVARHGALVAVVVGLVVLLGGGVAGSALGFFGANDDADDLSLVPVSTATPTPTATTSPSPMPTATPDRVTEGATPVDRGPTPSPPPPPELTVEPTRMRLPTGQETGVLALGVTHQPVSVSLSSDRSWIELEPTRAELSPAAPIDVVVRVDRSELPEGTNAGAVGVATATAGTVDVPVEVLVERAPVFGDVVGETRPETGPGETCVGTILDVAGTVTDESGLGQVQVVSTVDGQTHRETMSPDDDRWYGSVRAPANTPTIEWFVEATDVRGNTAVSDTRVAQGVC